MNKIMESMMKPIPTTEDSYARRKEEQEEYMLQWMEQQATSVSVFDVKRARLNVPYIGTPSEAWRIYGRRVSTIFKRLERKGKVISTLVGNSRFYSIPITGKKSKKSPTSATSETREEL